jgi:hypothetical protein
MPSAELAADVATAYEKFWSQSIEELNKVGVQTEGDYLNLLTDDGVVFPSEFVNLDQTERKKTPILRAFTRVYPASDQDVAIAALNPKIDERPSEPSSTLEELVRSTGSISEYAAACADNYRSTYLDTTRSNVRVNGFHELFRVLRDRGIISWSDGLNAYLRSNSGGDIFDDIYLTNWYKFGTGSQSEIGNLPSAIESYSTDCFQRELETIDADVLFAFGADIKEGLKPHLEDSLTVGAPSVDSGITELHGHAFKLGLDCDTDCILVGHQTRGWYAGRADDTHAQVQSALDAVEL